MKNKLADDKARQLIREELDKNFFVEAGAGSGKTTSLVDRLAGLIKYNKAKMENIAAVTFTRKAAAELRERSQIELERLINDKSTPEKQKEYIRSALLELERAFIGTVHSFCAKLLRELPVEAGIDPGFEELEEDESIIYAEIVWDEFLDRQSYRDAGVYEFMQENGIEPKDIKKIYLKMVSYPDVEVIRDPFRKPDFSGQKKEVNEFIKSFIKRCLKSKNRWWILALSLLNLAAAKPRRNN